jgi:hypothetical protein
MAHASSARRSIPTILASTARRRCRPPTGAVGHTDRIVRTASTARSAIRAMASAVARSRRTTVGTATRFVTRATAVNRCGYATPRP